MLKDQLGQLVLSDMQYLADNLIGIEYAILCTADGFNICALGLDDWEVGHIASTTSSLFSLCRALLNNLCAPHHVHERKEILMRTGTLHAIAIEIDCPDYDHLILLVTAQSPFAEESLNIVRYSGTSIEEHISECN